MGVDAGTRPGNLFVTDTAKIMDNVDPLSAIVSQIVLLFEEVFLIDMLPETRAEGFTAKDTGPSALVVPW